MSRLLCLMSVIVTAWSWDLKATHTNVMPGLTDNVTLRCVHGGGGNSSTTTTPTNIKTMLRIRLIKQDKADEKWIVFASLTLPSTKQVVLGDRITGNPKIVTSGLLGSPSESFLSITWSSASEATGGRYKCKVEGFIEENSNHLELETPEVAIIKANVTTTTLLGILSNLKEVIKEMSDKIETLSNNQREDSSFNARYWPAGPYALLATNGSCPDTPQSKMTSGYISNWYYSLTVPKHNTSEEIHLKGNLWGYRNTYYFLNTSFCTKNSNQSDQNILWPKGKYCLNAAPTCPIGFQFSVLSFNLVDNIATRVNAPPFADQGDGQTSYRFCCRDDGIADVPIVLPNEKPFYLYRFGGKCQSVLNTHVTNEWIEIDTDDSKWDRYSTRFHPDGKVNDVRVELCYYQKTTK